MGDLRKQSRYPVRGRRGRIGLPSYWNVANRTDEDEHAARDKSASAYVCCEEILAGFFFRTLGHQAVDVCQHSNLGLRIFDKLYIDAKYANKYDESRLRPVQGLRVLHGSLDPGYADESFREFVYAGPTRVFSKYSQGAYDGRVRFTADLVHQMHMRRFDRSISAYVESHPDRRPDKCHIDMTLRLDFRVLPAAEAADVIPEEAQIRMQIDKAQNPMEQVIKDEKEESEAQAGSMDRWRPRYRREALFLRRIPLDIYVGGGVPPCPACGLKE